MNTIMIVELCRSIFINAMIKAKGHESAVMTQVTTYFIKFKSVNWQIAKQLLLMCSYEKVSHYSNM